MQDINRDIKIAAIVNAMYENMSKDTIEDLVKVPIHDELKKERSPEEIDHLYDTMCAEYDVDTKHVKVAVACKNAGGEADFYFCKIKATDEDYHLGKHYDKAEEIAQDEGYEGPFIAFDEHEAAGRAVMNLFHWESASIFEIESEDQHIKPR